MIFIFILSLVSIISRGLMPGHFIFKELLKWLAMHTGRAAKGKTFVEPSYFFAAKPFTWLEGFKLPSVTKRPTRKLKSSGPRFPRAILQQNSSKHPKPFKLNRSAQPIATKTFNPPSNLREYFAIIYLLLASSSHPPRYLLFTAL